MCVSHSEALWLWPGFCNHLGTPAEFLMEWLKQIKSAFVGASLLAIAVYQLKNTYLTHRNREQAPSHKKQKKQICCVLQTRL